MTRREVLASLPGRRLPHLMFEFDFDQLLGNDLLRMQGGEPANEIFQFANVAGPAVALHTVERRPARYISAAAPR